MRSRAAKAIEAIEGETSVSAVLRAACRELNGMLEADGCNLSRVIGQLLVDLVDHSPDGRRIQLGRGYLIPDFPLTQEVIDDGEPRTVSVHDANADESEVSLLRELGFESLLMLPLHVADGCWGLVEIYRSGNRVFDRADVELARHVVAQVGSHLELLQRRAAA